MYYKDIMNEGCQTEMKNSIENSSSEKTIKSKVAFNGKIINVEQLTVTFDNGREAYREIARHNGGVGILAIDNDDNIMLVRQYRKAYEEFVLEIPAGKLEKEEDPYTCAKRELEEETGNVAEELVKLFEIYPSPGFLDEKLYIYKATKFHSNGNFKPDLDEYLDFIKLPFSNAYKMVLNGEIKDAKTIIAIMRESLYRVKKIEGGLL